MVERYLLWLYTCLLNSDQNHERAVSVEEMSVRAHRYIPNFIIIQVNQTLVARLYRSASFRCFEWPVLLHT